MTPRKQAAASGMKYYFTGRPCKHGHVAARLVTSGHCVPCVNGRAIEWRKANPEKAKLSSKKWLTKNIDRARAHAQAYYEANAEKRRENSRMWTRNNPQKNREKSSSKRAEKRNATPPWFGELDELVMVEAHDLAVMRERVTGIPLARRSHRPAERKKRLWPARKQQHPGDSGFRESSEKQPPHRGIIDTQQGLKHVRCCK